MSKGKNKKVLGLMKDILGGQIMKGFVEFRAETYNCLKDNNNEAKKKHKKTWKKAKKDTKKAKIGTKKHIIKGKLIFQDYKNCLEAAEIEDKINHLEKKWNWYR